MRAQTLQKLLQRIISENPFPCVSGGWYSMAKGYAGFHGLKGPTNMAYAHSGNAAGKWELVAEHLCNVSERASDYAQPFGAEVEARIAGLLHDLGKYGDLFQRRLRGEVHGIDHWSAGAWVALTQNKKLGIATALAIQGHHIGLQAADTESLRELDPRTYSGTLKLSEVDTKLLVDRLHDDGLRLPTIESSIAEGSRTDALAAMLDVRMLFSALVDADYLETEAHFEADPEGTPRYREQALPLEPERALEILQRHLDQLRAKVIAPKRLMQVRADLLSACRKAAVMRPGVFALSAPTGSGKTLSMLAFALQHAADHDLRRVVMVIPYLTIIEQTARIYRDIFAPHFGERYILEQHSLAGTRAPKRAESSQLAADIDNEDESIRIAGMAAENWDAPIIITTSVQLLESLFANRTSACRKLHNLARSVILFDEVQTLPSRLAIPTLAALAHLSERYSTSVVFATATQPAFSHLDDGVKALADAGWQPKEIVPPDLNLFSRLRRTQVNWPDLRTAVSWSDIARQVAEQEEKQVLCIVNLKRNAAELAKMLRGEGIPGLLHLSTAMCPAHRERVLSQVRQRLHDKEPCILISTQCVEAGVDVDFPVVYRAWGPLEAIAQAAGRCNRHGKQEIGEVHVFLPEEAGYPPDGYQRATDVTSMLLKHRGRDNMDIRDPSLFEEYYRSLYDLAAVADMSDGRARKLKEAILRRDFVGAAEYYRLISKDAINILVPFEVETYRALAEEARANGLKAEWIRRARAHTVGLIRPTFDAPIQALLEPVPLGSRGRSQEWFICLSEAHYDRELLGLVPPENLDLVF